LPFNGLRPGTGIFLGGSVRLLGGTMGALGGNVANTQQNTYFELRGTLASDIRASNCRIRLTGDLSCTRRMDLAGCDMYVQGNTLNVTDMTNENLGNVPGRIFLQGGTLNTGSYSGDGAVLGPGMMDGQPIN
jgi:hypothetical protein